ncbi:hypothetical protein ABDK56_06255 [Sphingomonas sp. ASV193]|uniref:hypothetical protein n=1 Tax=Sphingomonas sp. ASV193 TaxID=3144405 RepID=UPI0032E8E246
MGVGFFVIAIMGCTDGSAACTNVATLPTRYSSKSECVAATVDALSNNNNFDYPSLLAQCRPTGSASNDPEPSVPATARRG